MASDLIYRGLTVIEIADDPAGEQLGKLLADQGAEVIKIEPVAGAAGRGVGPFAHGEQDPDKSLHFWSYNTSKKSVVLPQDDVGHRQRDTLIATADVLITTGRPADLEESGLDLFALVERHPELIVVSISPFGLTGPWANYRSSDLVALAAGGLLMSCGYDDHSIPPIRPGGNQAYMTAASFSHCGFLLAMLERQQTGLGQLVDVSMHECIAVSGELANPYWFYPKVLVQRQTCRHAQPSPTQSSLYQCADGIWVYFAFIVSEQRTWLAVRDWMDSLGMAADLMGDEYLELAHRQKNFHRIQDMLECFFLIQDSEQVYHEGQRRGLPLGPLRAPEELLGDHHMTERGVFTPIEIAEGELAMFPQSPIRFSSMQANITRPPRLGEHTRQVMTYGA